MRSEDERSVRFHVLGALEVRQGGEVVPVAAGRERVLLAVLLLRAGRLVSIDELTYWLWEDQAPANPRAALHTTVNRLRNHLGRAREVIRSGPGRDGYLAEPDWLDLTEFRRLVTDADRAAGRGDRDGEAESLRLGLTLWRGPALSNVASEPVHRELVPALTEERLTVLLRRIEADLALGRATGLVAELRGLTAEHPLQERLWTALIRALNESGRRAEALTTYETVRRLLAEELGVDPGDELRRLHRQLLAVPEPATPPSPPLPPRPAQLPADIATFTGRAAELNRLLAAWPASRDNPPPSAVVISALDGMAGVGKTALAVHAAHRLARHFPDGQLFLDLHGYTQDIAPIEPADALDRLLRALGVGGKQVPTHLDDRAALLRTVLAGRRVLLVLDNASSEAQVSPLLPGTPGCLVLITSRHRLGGLDDAHTLAVEVLPGPEAVALFRRIAGPDRLANAPAELIDHIVELCGRLPLAIRIAAARLQAHPTWTPKHLAERLRDQQRRLDELHAGQRSVMAALNLSHRHLGAEPQRAYRLLGLHPGPVIDTYATAALLGTSLVHAGRLLDDLQAAHMVSEAAPGTYTFHDLTRAHAARRCLEHEPETDRRAALTRLFDHYAATAAKAIRVAQPYQTDYRTYLTSLDIGIDSVSPTFTKPAQAGDWLDAALPNLLAAATHAAKHGWPTHTIYLAMALHHHLRTRAHFIQAETLHTQALEAARQTGHLRGQVYALNGLGDVHVQRGTYEQATGWYDAALALARDIGDRTGEHRAVRNLGHRHRFSGRYEDAIECFEQALAIARDIGDRDAEMLTFYGLGAVHRVRGSYELAINCDRQALALARGMDHRDGELQALYGLGYSHRLYGHYDLAIDSYQQALAIAHDIGNRGGELYVLHGLGNVHHLHGDYGRAIDYYQQALALAKENHDRNGEFEAMHDLGRAHHATGQSDQALTCHRQALDLARELGQPSDQARAHHALAITHHSLGQSDQARRHWQYSLDILTDLGLTETDEVNVSQIKAHLDELGPRVTR